MTLDVSLVFLLLKRLVLLLFSVESDLDFFELLSELCSRVIHDPQLIIEHFFVLVRILLRERDFLLSYTVGLLHLDLLRFVGHHAIPEIVNSLAQILDNLILVRLLLLQAEKLLVRSFDVDSLFLTS